MKKLILIAALISCLLPFGTARAQARTGDEIFFRANQDFREGRYADAERGYGELVSSGQGNGHVYYNLGNALLKTGRLGAAILQDLALWQSNYVKQLLENKLKDFLFF